jgi:2-polyprenyl-3-methyl-5-hydroxy-6-metoxy-1,4-benzoquinol methylase
MNTAVEQLPMSTETRLIPPPSPTKFFETMHMYQRTAALKAAIELDLFTAVGDGLKTVPELAERINAPERGIRALCDFLVIMGFLTKTENRYGLTADSAVFLDKKSPAYLGSATKFLGSPLVTESFKDLAALVRSGGPETGQNGILAAEHPIWVDFARGMAPVVSMTAEQTEKLVRTDSAIKVLDIAAGHGLFGIAVARHNPKAKIVALDWPAVLTVAKENAVRSGVSDRHSLLPGNALEVSYGTGFDVVLVTNLLHQWDRPTIQAFLKKVYAALAPKGRVVVVEFVPNEDRVSPPLAASFVMNMFANTPGGDVYTALEYEGMLRSAGFSRCEVHSLLPTPQTAIIAARP